MDFLDLELWKQIVRGIILGALLISGLFISIIDFKKRIIPNSLVVLWLVLGVVNLFTLGSYEEMIFPYISQYANELSPLVDFQTVKNKLSSIIGKSEEKCSKHEKRLKASFIGKESIVTALGDYNDLANYSDWFRFVLHDSFATTYYATAIANIITEKSGVPTFFNDLMSGVKGETCNLELLSGHTNVWKIKRR